MTLTPPSRPRQTEAETRLLAHAHRVTDLVYLVGVRGYYKKTMGDPAKNDRGIYDDAIFVVGPGVHVPFNANTDPSARYRPGLACLMNGVWRYRLGIHNLSKPKDRQYPALVQAAPVTVNRDGRGLDTGWFGINIHRGSNSTTSSLGCQTIPPAQWDLFYGLVKKLVTDHGQKSLAYLLTES